MRKPDPGIFRLALCVAQASAEQCFYFDDRIMLVTLPGRLVSMHIITRVLKRQKIFWKK
jgi:FMN phosphatase YigB (HAD superfamily)